MSAPIAIIAHAHPSLSKGGAEIAAATLFRGLRALGVPAVFIVAVPEADRYRLELAADEYAVFHDPDRYDHLYHLAAPAVARDLCAVIEATGAEMLVFHHFLYLGLNSLRDAVALPGRRGTLVLHEFLAMCHHHGQMITAGNWSLCSAATASRCAGCYPLLGRPRFELRRQVVAEMLDLLAGFIAPSRFLADRFIAWGLPAARMHVVENGLAQPMPPSGQPPVERGRFVFGYFGQLNPFKGVDVLLRATALLGGLMPAPSIEIRIHGNIIGQPAGFLTRLEALEASQPMLRVMGPYDNDQVMNLMSDCDYVVVPSIWWENSPVVIQEAFAAGRPVICTGIGGMAEKVVPGVGGLHFRRDDAGHLAQVMLGAADRAVFDRLRAGLPRPGDAPAMARQYLAVLGLSAPDGEAPNSKAIMRTVRRAGTKVAAT